MKKKRAYGDMKCTEGADGNEAERSLRNIPYGIQVDSNQDVLDFMFSSNLEPGRKSVSTFDFSTLYTPFLMTNLSVI